MPIATFGLLHPDTTLDLLHTVATFSLLHPVAACVFLHPVADDQWRWQRQCNFGAWVLHNHGNGWGEEGGGGACSPNQFARKRWQPERLSHPHKGRGRGTATRTAPTLSKQSSILHRHAIVLELHVLEDECDALCRDEWVSVQRL